MPNAQSTPPMFCVGGVDWRYYAVDTMLDTASQKVYRRCEYHTSSAKAADGFIEMIILLRLLFINLFCTLFLMQNDHTASMVSYFILFFSFSLWLEITDNKKLKIVCFTLFILSVFALDKNLLFFSPVLLVSDFDISDFSKEEQDQIARHILPRFFDAKEIAFKAIIVCSTLINVNVPFFVFTVIIFFYTIEKKRYDSVSRQFTVLQDSLTEYTLQSEVQKRHLQNEALKNSEAALLTERNRISGELHNSIGHTISAAILQVNALQYIATQDEVKTNLDMLQHSLETGLTEIRNCLHNLHNDSFDLQTSIEKLIAAPAQTLHIRLTCKTETMPYTLKYDILSVIKECLSNTVKHSGASAMTISILEHPAFYSVSVRDNGTGWSGTEPCVTGIGLTVLREIAAKHNGAIHFYAQDGFKVHITFPKK